jgi:hypothetical protein
VDGGAVGGRRGPGVFVIFSKKDKLNIFIMGFNIENDDFLQLNTTLTKSVQNFILKTKRFEMD